MRHIRLDLSAIRHIALLIVIPLVLTGTGYALFSQELSVQGAADKPAYASSQNLLLTYTKTSTQVTAQRWRHDLSITVQNTGTQDINAWNATFTIPSNVNQFSCTIAVCTNTSGSININNGTSNGFIAAGGSVTFTMTYRLTVASYVLQNITISGTFAPVYQNMAGLTQSFTRGTRSRSGAFFYWPHNFTVSNQTGQAISAWKISIPWDSSTNAIRNPPANINYVVSATQLTVFSTAGIASGGTFAFTLSLGSTSNAWVLTGVTIQGAP